MSGQVVAQLADGVQLLVLQTSNAGFVASLRTGEWPAGRQLTCTLFEADRARVDIEDQPPSLWLGKTNFELPWLELLKVADFLQLDIPLTHPPEGTEVQS